MELIDGDFRLILDSNSLVIQPIDSHIPLYTIKDFVVFNPCRNISGALQLTLYDFFESDKKFYTFLFNGESNCKCAYELADVIHKYSEEIEESDSLKFLESRGFSDLKEKKAYLKYLILQNEKIKSDYP